MSDTDAKPRHGNPSWVRGGPSPNPGGRTPAADALQNAIRRKADADELFEIAMAIARGSDDERNRLAALTWLREAGYSKPAAQVDVTATAIATADPRFAELSTDELRARLAAARAALPSATGADEH